MMEPDVRIRTNERGFCRTHYDMMFVRKNRLGMGLTLESHLNELKKEIRSGGFASRPPRGAAKLESQQKETADLCLRPPFAVFNITHFCVILLSFAVFFLWNPL